MGIPEKFISSLLERNMGSKELALLNQSLRITANTDLSQFILLSVSDNPISLGSGTSYDDFSLYRTVEFYSESIELTGSLLSPHGISISCNEIISTKSTTISSSGARGDDQVIGGSGAKPGSNGGHINFYIQSGSSEVARNVSFMAAGGSGGDVHTANAEAGDGGDGGTIIRTFQSRYSGLLGVAYHFLSIYDSGNDADMSSTVNKGDPAYLSAAQLLTSASKITIIETKLIERIHALRNLLSSIDNGISSKVLELVIKVRFIRNSLEEIATQQEENFSGSAHSEGGYGGSGNGMGRTGAKGKDGTVSYYFMATYDPNTMKSPFAFAHPEQCAMLLERGKIFYYMGSPELCTRAEAMFQRLVDRLGYIPTEAYTESDLSTLKSIRTDASNMLIQLASGVSFNGYPHNWAPRASYAIYDQVLDKALEDHKAFEDAYIKYHTALDKQERLTDSVGIALQQSTQMIGSLTQDINNLVADLLETEKRVASLTDPVKIAHRLLMNKFEELKDQIQNHFSLTVPELLNALTKFATVPSKLVAIASVGNYVYDAFTAVPDINGQPANKNYIIGKITLGEATVKSIKDTLGQSLDGEFVIDDPLGTRLMMDEDDMMKFLDAYAYSSFKDVIEKIKDLYDAFIATIVERNKQAVLYNMQLKLYIEKIASRDEYEKKWNDLKGKEIQITDPALPSITAYMDSIYQSSRARVTNYLDNLVRSLNFRMLTSHDIFHLAFSGSDPDAVPQIITSDVLRSGRSRIQDQFFKTVEIWGSEPARFPQNFNDPRGKRIYLDNSDLTSLKNNHQVEVKIPVTYKDTSTITDFSGCCNVRIYRVRFGMTGLISKQQAYVNVNLKHKGEETLVDRKNVGNTYVHDPISITYSYTLNPDGKVEILDNGNIAEADVDNPEKNYAAPGPFPVDGWVIDLRASALTALDFSNVTEAYFDFCGTNYAF